MLKIAEIPNFFAVGIWSLHSTGIGRMITMTSRIRLIIETLKYAAGRSIHLPFGMLLSQENANGEHRKNMRMTVLAQYAATRAATAYTAYLNFCTEKILT